MLKEDLSATLLELGEAGSISQGLEKDITELNQYVSAARSMILRGNSLLSQDASRIGKAHA